MAAATASSVAVALGGARFPAPGFLVPGSPSLPFLPNPRRFLAGPVLHLSGITHATGRASPIPRGHLAREGWASPFPLGLLVRDGLDLSPLATAGLAAACSRDGWASPPSGLRRRLGLFSSDVQRFSAHKLRASSSEETSGSIQTEELIADLKEKWDSIENKSTVFVYGGGAIVAVWLSSIVISAVNSVPLLPKLLELIGLGYTGWFVYRYLLFKSSRKELAEDIESLKKKIAGTE